MPTRTRGRSREDARRELCDAVAALGYPEEFAAVLADELGGAWGMRRLATYLRQAQPSSPEQIADEMLAIVAQRRSWVTRKRSERANDAITSFYNRPREEEGRA